ncbi:uncharacterized protein LOC118432880 [Folsomia candida]|uniref:uncharacterized protein LOC118432880 n=1 Tax=Folsomia candida TaxID=158441 RepID=UPI000B901528|nr:uncharacterized protein LOC118432880 [Folsomia candida]
MSPKFHLGVILSSSFIFYLVQPAQCQLASAIIPLYNFPNFKNDSDESWQPLLDAKSQYQNVSAWVIGGTPKDYNWKVYQAAYKKLLDVGLNIIGYVNTGHATIPVQTVTDGIDKWRQFFSTFSTFPTVKSAIFFDNMHNGMNDGHQARTNGTVQGDVVKYYETIARYAKSQGLTKIVMNPASYVNESLVGVADTFNILESSYGFQAEKRYQQPKYGVKYPIQKWGAMINNIVEGQLSHEEINVMKKYVKHIWVSEWGSKGAPSWYRLPKYVIKLFRYLSY